MMSFRLCTLQIWRAAVTLAVSGLLICSVQAAGRQRGRAIEFSAPKSDEVTTNLHQLTSKKDSLKQLEEDLYKPLQSFAPRGSLDGVVAPPVRPPSASVIQSKRAKELLERRKNWMFMTPEDLLGSPTVDEILKAPEFGADGQEKKHAPTFETYYQRLATKRPAANNPSQSKEGDLFGPARKSSSTEQSDLQEDSDLPGGLRESAEALNQLFDPSTSDSPFARVPTQNRFSDTFGLGAQTLSKEQAMEHKKFMDEYRAVLPGNPIAIIADSPSPAYNPAAGLPNSPSSAARRGLDAQSDVINPLLGPPALPDVNARALGQTRPTPAIPTVEAPRVAPVAPKFTAPTRSFR